MPRYKESCYHELKSLGILAATYKHAQDAFSTNKSLLEFCHLKLTTKNHKSTNQDTLFHSSNRQKLFFGNRLKEDLVPRRNLKIVSLTYFFEIIGFLELTLTSPAPPDVVHLYIENSV